MSIIQEALKKVQDVSGGSKDDPKETFKNIPDGESATRAKKAAPSRSPRPVFKPPLILLMIFLALVFFGVREFYKVANRNSPASLYETIYRPMSKAEASPAEPVASKRKSPGFPSFVLSGIVQLVNGPKAIINDVMVGVGDVVNGATVQKISKDSVVLKKRDSEITLGME